MRTKEIKKWMIDAGMTNVKIGKSAGLSSNHVSNVIHGRRNSDSIRRALLRLGCPVEFLDGDGQQAA